MKTKLLILICDCKITTGQPHYNAIYGNRLYYDEVIYNGHIANRHFGGSDMDMKITL